MFLEKDKHPDKVWEFIQPLVLPLYAYSLFVVLFFRPFLRCRWVPVFALDSSRKEQLDTKEKKEKADCGC